MIKTLELSGTHYEIGYQVGTLFKDYLSKRVKDFEPMMKLDDVKQTVSSMKEQFEKEYPQGYEEVLGRKDGAGIDSDAFFLMFFPEIYKKHTGCTTIMVRDKDGQILFSHNEDDEGFNEDNVALIRYHYGDYWITGYTHAEKLIGCFFGYNSYGLAFSSNNISSFTTRYDYVSRYLLERKILEAKSLPEAIRIANGLRVATPFSINVVDIERNEAANIEKDHEEIYVTYLEDRYNRSNHFLKKQGEVKISGNTVFRYEKAKELLQDVKKETVVLDDLINILSYREDDRYQSIRIDTQANRGNNKTVANFAVNVKEKKIYLRDYVGDHLFLFDFYDFKDLNQ